MLFLQDIKVNLGFATLNLSGGKVLGVTRECLKCCEHSVEGLFLWLQVILEDLVERGGA